MYRNPGAALSVEPNSEEYNKFRIVPRFMLGAGACREAVRLGDQCDPNVTLSVSLGQTYEAIYHDVPSLQTPSLVQGQPPAAPTSIGITTNAFTKASNEAEGWFANQSFGITTEQGVAWVTWSPEPNQSRTLTPVLAFWVAVGNFSGALENWNISAQRGQGIIESDFRSRQVSVTYHPDGTWSLS